MPEKIKVSSEPTPNPQSFKFNFDRQISDDSAQFGAAEETGRSPLATKLFGFPWVDAVFVGTDFVTVTKQDWVDWDVLVEPLTGLIAEHIDHGYAALLPEKSNTGSDEGVSGDDTSDVAIIKRVINTEIKPAVAMDGGDIVFHKYENQIVYIYMQGACAGCPSSTYTLKMGIETRLKEALPSIREVVAL